PPPPPGLMPPPPPRLNLGHLPFKTMLNSTEDFISGKVGDKNTPAFVIDGKIAEQSTVDLDPDDIESISVIKPKSPNDPHVLKYGPQAINGVIFITTKPTDSKKEYEDEIFKVVEEMPRFPGCENEPEGFKRDDCAKTKMLEYVYSHLKYPALARVSGIQGQVVVQFVITKDGKVANIKIARDIGGGTAEAVFDMIKSMNTMEEPWIAGKQRGKNVGVLYTLPVKFKLEGDTKSTSSVINPSSNDKKPQKTIKDFVLEMPLFQVGDDVTDPAQRMGTSFRNQNEYIQNNIKYPTKAKDNNIEGICNVRVMIDEHGKVTDAVITEDIGYGTEEEALRVVKNMPNWIPVIKDGKKIATTTNITVSFKLNGNKKNSGQASIKADKTEMSAEVKIFPNPTNDVIDVQWKGKKEDVTIVITDMKGSELYNVKHKNDSEVFNKQINVRDFNTAMVVVTIIQGAQKISKQVVLKD
ncbi:MAG: TonB family protein, partial [Saprospiraceae bacterium]